MGFGLGGFGQCGIELRLLVCGERFGAGDGVESGEAGGSDGGEVAGSSGRFVDQKRFWSELRVDSVVVAPLRELGAEFGGGRCVVACASEEIIYKVGEVASGDAFELDGVDDAVERSLAGGFDGGSFFAIVVFHRFDNIG